MLPVVRSRSGTPVAADFSSATGTPIVVNTTNGTAYVYVNGAVVPLGPVANVRGFGAVGDGVANDTAAIQAAIDSFTAGNGEVFFPRGTYKVTSQLTVAQNRVNLVGEGQQSTKILFAPTANGTCVKYAKGINQIVEFSIRDLSFYSDDSTYTKTAIELVDASIYAVERVSISGSVVVASTSYWGGASSIGIKTKGREAANLNAIYIAADRPIVFGENPNSGIDQDHYCFRDLYLIANANPCVEAETGLAITNLTFDGYQAWVLGTHGFLCTDTTSVSQSLNWSFNNIRWEQGTSTTAYLIRIEANTSLSGLTVKNCYGGSDRKGIYLRKVTDVLLDRFSYVSATLEAMNVDSTCARIQGVGCLFQAGSTASMAGQRLIWGVPKSPSTGALPPDFFYNQSALTEQGIILGGGVSEATITLANAANTTLGASAMSGMLIVADSEGLNAIFSINGTNGTVNEVSDPSGVYSAVAGTATSTNVYWDGVSNYRIQNNRAASRNYKIHLVGSYTSFV